MAGIIISQVAEDNSDKIDKLVYVSAFAPDNGGSLTQEEKKGIRPSISPEMVVDQENNKIAIIQSKS